MATIIFISMFSMAVAGYIDNAPLGWKIAFVILLCIAEIRLLYEEHLQEKLQDRVETLEKKLKEMVGEDNA